MKRRDFITLIGGAAAWPLPVKAAEPDRIRRVGMLTTNNDPDTKAFQQELEKRGWSEGRNIHIEHRVAPGATQVQTIARELVATQPEVIFAQSRPATAALQKETRTIPIVFSYVIDPIGAGFVTSFARPGGNHHRLHGLRAKRGWKMDEHAQGDRAANSTCGTVGKSENRRLL